MADRGGQPINPEVIQRILDAVRRALTAERTPITGASADEARARLQDSGTGFSVRSTGTVVARINRAPGDIAQAPNFAKGTGLGVLLGAAESIRLASHQLRIRDLLRPAAVSLFDLHPTARATPPIDRIWDNVAFRIPLETPGGLEGANNEDNWGIGPSGLKIAELWRFGSRGRGVRIGTADSGIDYTHPAFEEHRRKGLLVGFVHFDEQGQLSAGSGDSPTFSHWHGTHCAAILVGNETDGKARGIAPEAEFAVAQVLNDGNEGSVASFKSGFHWLASQKCDVVSLSLGWAGLHEEWADEIQELINGGSVVVAASGNEFPAEPTRSPGNYPVAGLISVGAMGRDGSIWDSSGGAQFAWPDTVTALGTDGSQTTVKSLFANTGTRLVPTTAGPGIDIVSAVPNGAYRVATGTSMATPHIAGMIALVLSILRLQDPRATATEAAGLIVQAIATPPGPDDRVGLGEIATPKIIDSLHQHIQGASGPSGNTSEEVVGTLLINGESFRVIR